MIFETSASRVAAVRRPTVPLTGNNRCVRWKRLTAALVIDPKNPVAGTE